MLPLLVRIHDTRSGQKKTQGFSQSPVRVGRNKLNELVLESQFASQWHAVIRFDDNKTVYVDLGSTNGTAIEGKRIAKNAEVEVTDSTEIAIGDLRIRFARAMIPKDIQLGQRSTTFLFSAQQPAAANDYALDANVHTVMLGMPGFGGAEADERTIASTGPSPVEVAWFQRIADNLRPLEEAVAASQATFLQHIEHYLASAEPEARGRALQAILERNPKLAFMPGFGATLEKMRIDPKSLGIIDFDAWIKRITGVAPGERGVNINRAVFLERVGGVLETFSQSYVDLRAGYRQFTTEVAVQSGEEPHGLGRASDAQKVLAYLFDPVADPSARIEELTRSFADMAIHQVALLSGLIEGVRSLLTQLAPQTALGLEGNAPVPTPSGALAFFQAPRLAKGWRKIVGVHQSLLEGDRFTRELFGRSFARAYYAVTGDQLRSTAASSGPQALPSTTGRHN